MSWNAGMIRGGLGLALAVIALTPWASPARMAEAATLTVTKTADTNDGTCDSDCSLREAINAAGSGDNVSVPAGTYMLSIAGAGENAGATGDLDVLVNLTIDGAGAATTIIDGGALDYVMEVRGTASLTLDGVTVRNGGFAGGINTYSGNIDVTNSRVTGNPGTGINTYSGNVSVTGSTVDLNDDGGINTYSGNVSVTGSTVDDNGWGINTYAGNIVVTDSTVDANRNTGINTYSGDVSVDASSVSDNGGGINTSSGNVSVGSSNVVDNTDTGINTSSGNVSLDGSTASENDGSGVNTGGGTILAVNSTVSGNADTNIDTSSGIIDLTNVTVADSHDGDGIRNGEGSTTMTNTLVSGHGEESSDCSIAGTIGGGHNLDSDGSCDFGGAGNISGADPMLGALADNGGPTYTMALLAGSPAIDAGTNSGCPATDQRGVSRPVNGTCDIGAYEAGIEGEPATSTPTSATTSTATATHARAKTHTPTPSATPEATNTQAPAPTNTPVLAATLPGGGAAGVGTIRLPDTGGNSDVAAGGDAVTWATVLGLALAGLGLAAAAGIVTGMRRDR